MWQVHWSAARATGEERVGGKARRGCRAVCPPVRGRPWCTAADRVSVLPGVVCSTACVAGVVDEVPWSPSAHEVASVGRHYKKLFNL
jgi:hypothetical protein